MSVRPSIIIPNMPMPKLSRRSLLKFIAAAAPSAAIPKALLSQGASPHHIAPGPFQPSWDSLTAGYQTPDWFRDAKFGIWSCWGPESMPEQGDWYTRNLYLQGSKQNKFHVANYGHPSKFGAVELNGTWKAERWQPEQLMDLFVSAGAKYFVALAQHHDNFDIYNSRFHEWNSVKVARTAFRRLQPRRTRLALASGRVRLRSRRTHARRPLRRL